MKLKHGEIIENSRDSNNCNLIWKRINAQGVKPREERDFYLTFLSLSFSCAMFFVFFFFFFLFSSLFIGKKLGSFFQRGCREKTSIKAHSMGQLCTEANDEGRKKQNMNTMIYALMCCTLKEDTPRHHPSSCLSQPCLLKDAPVLPPPKMLLAWTKIIIWKRPFYPANFLCGTIHFLLNFEIVKHPCHDDLSLGGVRF